MKAILVIDKPEDFDYRRCSMGGDGNIYYEREGEQRISIIGNIKNLKPIPKRIGSASEYGSDEAYIKHLINWKKEVDEILGGNK